jgi:hypothetical protein
MTDKNARSILLSKDTLGGGHVVCKRSFRFLDDADFIAVLDKNVVHAFPARAIGPSAVDQNNIRMRCCWFCAESAPQVNSNKTMQKD